MDAIGFLTVILVSVYLVAGLEFNRSTWNSCSPRPGRQCRRCDCVPDCMDLSDEKNCSYGNLQDLFLSMKSILRREAARPTEHQCGTSQKFFPPPPPPPFPLCDPPTTPKPATPEPTPTTMTIPTQTKPPPSITTMPSAAPITKQFFTIPSTPKTQTRIPPTRGPRPTWPCRPSVRPATASLRPATTERTVPTTARPVTPPPVPVPTTIGYLDFFKVRDFCKFRHTTLQAVQGCVHWIYYCFAMPQSCRVPLITTTTTTLAPVTPYYNDYYDYTQNFFWNIWK